MRLSASLAVLFSIAATVLAETSTHSRLTGESCCFQDCTSLLQVPQKTSLHVREQRFHTKKLHLERNNVTKPSLELTEIKGYPDDGWPNRITNQIPPIGSPPIGPPLPPRAFKDVGGSVPPPKVGPDFGPVGPPGPPQWLANDMEANIVNPTAIRSGDFFNMGVGHVGSPFMYYPNQGVSWETRPTRDLETSSKGDPYLLGLKTTMTKVGKAVNIAEDHLGRGTWLPYYDGHATVAFAQPYTTWMGTGPITGQCKVAVFKSLPDNREELEWTRREPGVPALETAMYEKGYGWPIVGVEPDGYTPKEWSQLRHALNNPAEMEFHYNYGETPISMSVGMARLPLPATVKALQEYSQFLATVDVMHEIEVTPPRDMPKNYKVPVGPTKVSEYETYQTPQDQIWDMPKKSNESGKTASGLPMENRTASFVFVDLNALLNTATLFPMKRIDVYHHDISKWGSGNIFGVVNT